jgi:hypothetical protein
MIRRCTRGLKYPKENIVLWREVMIRKELELGMREVVAFFEEGGGVRKMVFFWTPWGITLLGEASDIDIKE